jgi:lipopolysaccharide transport system permease protein
LIKRDFITQYKQTILGPLWYLIQPVLTTLMFLLLFSRVARIPTEGMHPTVFYMSGLTLWTYFSVTLTTISSTFVSNASIFGKVYFPRLVMPLSVMVSNLMRFLIQFGLLLVFMAWHHFHGFPVIMRWTWLMIPFLLILTGALSLGLGILVASLTTKYRDLTVLMSFLVQLLMYATPIAYPFSYLSGKSLGEVLAWNPLTALVECYRYCLFGVGSFSLGSLMYSFVFCLIVMFCGLVVFNRVEKSFMDTV